MNRIALGLALAGAAGSALLWWQYEGAMEDLAVAERRVTAHQAAAERTRAALDELQAERKRAQAAIADARRREVQIQEEARQLRAEIQHLKETDDAVDEWSRRPLPGALVERLRDLPGGRDADREHTDDPAGGADRADPDPGDAG
jgi:chromosome segregation ATPase